MFPSFTGSSRKPRNINLSGRKSAPPSRGPLLSRTQVHSTSLLNAQQERAQREAERQRLKAAITIQRVWRGRKATELQRKKWREEWDSQFAGGKGVWVQGVALFLAFYDRGFGKLGRRREERDLERMGSLVLSVMDEGLSGGDVKRERYILRRFARLLIQVMDEDIVREDVLRLLPWLSERLPELVDARYYGALSRATTLSMVSPDAILAAVLAPLRLNGSDLAGAYRMFAANYLVTPELPERLGKDGFNTVRQSIDLGSLVKAMEDVPGTWTGVETEGQLWLLAYILDFSHNPSERKTVIDLTEDKTIDLTKDSNKSVVEERCYIRVLSMLLSSVSGEAGKRIDIEDVPMGDDDSEDEDPTDSKASLKRLPLPPFIKSRLQGLIQQSSVSTVFSQTNSGDRDDARILAGFALTLLLVFPARRQEVRMWLCLAETSDGASAVRFLWEAVKRTSLFAGIKKDHKVAVASLRRRNTFSGAAQASDDEEWNLILLFVELYGFLLIVMDDDEFFAGGKGGKKERQLPLGDVEELSVFLKNMAFAMYWSGGEIMGEDKPKGIGGEVFFKDQSSKGWDVEYMRGVVTGLLKLVYTRDSRRRFLRKDHWLMTDRFIMEGFIPSVVQEEENRHQMENDDEEPEEEGERPLDPVAVAAMNPYERRNLRLERLKRSQRKQQRNNYLAAITPRLEILKNLPFFIPFATRVQIFREFVLVDQKRRRGGFIDPDQWRAAVLSRSGNGAFPRHDGNLDGHDRLSAHHATIRRNRVFEDAYKQFWPLGEGLKEPIQITFVDQFGTEEAGIDGGGVTKEFLTGVCGEAFTPATFADTNAGTPAGQDNDEDDEDELSADAAATIGKNLFLENEQHLLYPNPTSIEGLKEELHQMGVVYPELVEKKVKSLLRRYEFLGRIVGKCLYEGILVDVGFAGFFLLRWSQQAGDKPGSATAGVGVNDLRDLDEDLYRGLVTLKNYNGNVESDFALNFTITSRLPKSDKTITVELKPDGEKILVTNANKLEYIHLVSRYRLSVQPHAQTAAFLKGINTIIKPSWLSMFNQTELQTLVGGDINTPIDVEDLRRNTIYGGVYQIGDDGREHESVRLFWEVMKELGDEERRKVLKFVTSVARAPLLGFGVLRPRFSIRDAGEDQARLCSASTCVNLLKMPRYKDSKVLKEKLLYSVNSNAGFDLS